jgi:single-strand DNA-binding protein
MNTINITGRLTTELELKHTQSGTAVCTYTLAVKRPKVKDTTDFITFVTWRQGAEYLCNYAHKGDMIAATGTLTSRKWQDKDGNNRTSFEVVTDTVEIVSNAQNRADTEQPTTYIPQPRNAQNGANFAQQSASQDYMVISDDLPF